MLWLKNQSKTLVGIDIGTQYIKLIELEHSNTHTKVLHYAIGELPITVLTESNEIKNSATISNTLADLRSQHKITTSKAAIAMPGSSTVTKKIVLDAGLTDQDMESQAWLEASKHFPELIEDLSLDFYTEGPAEKDQNHLDVLLVACRKTSIQKLVEILQDSHFQAEVVDVDYYALERILKYILNQQTELDNKQSYAILNFNTYSSTLVVIQDNKLVYAHDHVFDGQRIFQRLEQDMEVSDLLLQPVQIKTDFDISANMMLTDLITNHVNYVLELLYSSLHGVTIQKLFLAGDCAIIPKLAELVMGRTGIDTSIANPILNMTLASEVSAEELQIVAPTLTLCCGLALHEGKP